MNLSSFTQALSFEDQQTFLKLWMKSKKGIPVFASTIESQRRDGETESLEGSQGA
jgi:hypothetical protein